MVALAALAITGGALGAVGCGNDDGNKVREVDDSDSSGSGSGSGSGSETGSEGGSGSGTGSEEGE
jgi:hypothetical protein